MPKTNPIFVLTSNHFDQIWRRCWDRRFTFKGDTFVSYADIEDYYITDNLALARKYPEYRFEIESTIVIRKYLERHPERRAAVRKLVAQRRLAVYGAGDNVVDSNMILGESLVRNFVTGLLWLEKHLGFMPKVGVRNDAFGNSAQLPQIFRGCGLKWVTGLYYSPLKGKYWRGLDGSTVCAVEPPTVAGSNYWRKHAPCPVCRGKGCRTCAGRGIEPAHCRVPLPAAIDAASVRKWVKDFGCGGVVINPEELLPNPEVVKWVREQRAHFDVRFGLKEDALPFVQKWLDQTDNPLASDVHPGVELNANSSGCLVTRIKLKQTCRRQEYALLAAETLSALATLKGAAYPRQALLETWQQLLFTMFHDAVTASHVDPAYAELRDVAARIDARTAKLQRAATRRLIRPARSLISVVNPLGRPATAIVSLALPGRSTNIELHDDTGQKATVYSRQKAGANQIQVEFLAEGVAPLGAKTYRVCRSKRVSPSTRRLSKPVIENERFAVTADQHGLVCIHDKRLGRDLAVPGEYRPNEMILERDEGSPWATLHPDRTRRPLSQKTELLVAEGDAVLQRLVFRFVSPVYDFLPKCGCFCEGRTTVTLRAGIARVDFHTEVNWDNYNTRLRVAMPLSVKGRGVYGIPYGMLERQSYEPQFHLTAANGDWPAINWAGVQASRHSVALLSKGLPSYAIEDQQVILLSVLRSPANPTNLHEPMFYTMTDFDGMRDAGHHQFEYALTAYAQPFAASDVDADAEHFNAGLLAMTGQARWPKTPEVHSKHIRIAALKWAEEGDALLVRLCEFRGKQGGAVLVLPEGVKSAAKVNLLERDGQSLEICGERVEFLMRAWEIATVRIEFR